MIDQDILDRLAAIQPALDAAASAIRAALAAKGYEATSAKVDNNNSTMHGQWSANLRVKGAQPFTLFRGERSDFACEFGKTPQEALTRLLDRIAKLPDPNAYLPEMDWRILREFEERRAGA
jgi:hypothetical protein